MTRLGFALSSEQYRPDELIDLAVRAEEAGFEFTLLSDHFHPWLAEQGESPFVWTTLGGMARATDEIEIGTGVTCPIIRIHPANVAQAAATAASMMEDRFFLGVGTGETLNEHVTGERWPAHSIRVQMLREAVEVIRELWDGGMTSHYGEHFTVENARLFTLPENTPPIHVAAGGPKMADAASDWGDGMIGTAPDEEVIDTFRSEEGDDRPRYGQMTTCYADTEEAAQEIAYENWRNGGLPGELGQELATPKQFDDATQLVDPDELGESLALGPDPEPYIESIETYAEAGYDHVYIHQVNPDADGFMELFRDEIAPQIS